MTATGSKIASAGFTKKVFFEQRFEGEKEACSRRTQQPTNPGRCMSHMLRKPEEGWCDGSRVNMIAVEDVGGRC